MWGDSKGREEKLPGLKREVDGDRKMKGWGDRDEYKKLCREELGNVPEEKVLRQFPSLHNFPSR